jgi:hypothetical protein
MAVTDHFNQKADAGFVRTYDMRAARRQFEISVLLVVVLAVAAFALGISVRFDVPESVVEMQQFKANPTFFVGAPANAT